MNAYVLWKPTDLVYPNYLSPLAAYTTLEEAVRSRQGDSSIEITEVTFDLQLSEDLVKDENDRDLREALSGDPGPTRIKKAYVVWSPGKSPFAFRNSAPLVVFTSPGHAWEWREWFQRKMGDHNIGELQISEVSLDPDPKSPMETRLDAVALLRASVGRDDWQTLPTLDRLYPGGATPEQIFSLMGAALELSMALLMGYVGVVGQEPDDVLNEIVRQIEEKGNS